MLENLASLFSQKLLLLPCKLPVVFLFKCVKVRLHLKQVTVEFKLLRTHVKMLAAELFPFFVSIVLFLHYFMFLPGLFTNELSVAIVFFKPNMMV